MGVKRGQDSEASKAAAAKRSKTDALLEDVVRAVEAAATRQTLSQPGRRILVEMARHGLAAPVEERHEFQVAAVLRVAEALEAEQAALQEASTKVQAKLQEAITERDNFDNEKSRLEETLTSKATPARSTKVSLAEVTKAVIAANKALKAAEMAKETGDVERNVVKAEKDELIGAISKNLGALRTGASDGEACPHLTALLALGSRLELDEALVNALPHTVAKAPEARRRFDQLTLDQYEEGVNGRISTLDKQLAETAPEAAAREDAVKTAKEAVETAKANLLAAAADFKAAQAAHQEAAAALQDADKRQRENKKSVKNLEQAVKGCQADIELYETGTLANFQALKERSLQVAPSQQTAEAGEATTAQAIAEPAAEVGKTAADAGRPDVVMAVGGQ
eukprot:TRINITY_DN6656_c0_g1_i1.p1 TRINITY_DN6656_c0_g1~~TRINITY_DN6656_c0_g1_i1.p1  ORF type:complete len:395 (-),score=158.07 TRINITY_DN6656_c0_g1_i1:179-1363(-)